jgi:enoyl-CoA hydratase/carnithine racemase
MDFTVTSFDTIDAVGVIKMHNPPVNALGPEFLEDFIHILENLEKSDTIRSVLLASDCPGFFSAGDDIEGLKQIDDRLVALLPQVHAMLDTFEALPLPTIAVINGHALGGGLELALVCDFRFMGEDCGRIGLPEVRLGLIPAFGGSVRLPTIVGKAKALEMMFKGLQITSDEALNIGLVNGVFPQEDLFEKSLDYARRLARQATGAIGRIKQCTLAGLRQGFKKGMAMERAAFKENIVTHDAKEGIDAFLSGRKPEFKGK